MTKKPIDQIRDASFSLEIGMGEETGLAGLFLSTQEGLFVVKERATYKIIHADQVDPTRSNIDLPNTQQRILSVGFNSEILGRTLLTADNLIKKDFMPTHVQCDSAKGVVMRILIELIALEEIVEGWKKHKEEAEQDIKLNWKDAPKVPSIDDLWPKFKTAVQRGDHVIQMILDLVRTFFPSWDLSRRPFDSFVENVRRQFPDGQFGDLAAGVASLRGELRMLRDCVEHSKPGQTISIENYHLLADGNVHTPTFTIEHPKFQGTRDIIDYWNAVFVDSLGLVELIIVYLCGAVAQLGDLPISVVFLEEEKRRLKSVRYSYAVTTSQGVMLLG